MRAGSKLLIAVFLLILWSAACSPSAQKPSYPEKTVNVVVAFPTGSATDLVTRAAVEATKPFFPQPIAIINRTGGGGSVGAAEVVQAKPDGYNLAAVGVGVMTTQPNLTDLPYKGPDDYRPVISMASSVTVFAVRADAPWKTMKEALDYAKANPGKMRVGTAALASVQHIDVELLKEKAGVDMTHVPFSGEGENMTALLGGHIEASTTQSQAVTQHLQAKTVRLLATFEEKRTMYQDAPTMRELGYDVTQQSYFLIFAPKGTPDPVVQIINDAFKKGLDSEAFKKYARDSIMIVDGVGLDDLKKRLQKDYTLYGDLINKLNLKGKV